MSRNRHTFGPSFAIWFFLVALSPGAILRAAWSQPPDLDWLVYKSTEIVEAEIVQVNDEKYPGRSDIKVDLALKGGLKAIEVHAFDLGGEQKLLGILGE